LKNGKETKRKENHFKKGKNQIISRKERKNLMASPPFQIVLGDDSDISKFITSHFLWEIIWKGVKEEFGSLEFPFIVLTKGVLQKAEQDTVWKIAQFASFLPSDEVNWLPPPVTWPLEKDMLADSRQREEILRALMEHLATRNLVSIVPKGIKISTGPTKDEKYCFHQKAKPQIFEDEVGISFFQKGKRKRISPTLNLTYPFNISMNSSFL